RARSPPTRAGASPPARRRGGDAARSSFAASGHHVADAAHRPDELGIELLAQVMHVDLDGVALHRFAPAVELFFELSAGEHAPLVQQELLQERELTRRQLDGRTVE